MKKSTIRRKSNVELLRIVTMLMIVETHFASHGEFKFDYQIINIPRIW